MLCKDCQHFEIQMEPMKDVDFGLARCKKHNLVTEFLNHKKFDWLECAEEDEEWKEEYTYIKCPKCGAKYDDEIFYTCDADNCEEVGGMLRYCPRCGEKLRMHSWESKEKYETEKEEILWERRFRKLKEQGYICGYMYGHPYINGSNGRKRDKIVRIDIDKLKPNIVFRPDDPNNEPCITGFTFTWGWPGPDYNIYSLSDYGKTWALTLEEIEGYEESEVDLSEDT